MTDTNKMRNLLAAATPLPWAVSYGDESWAVVGTKPDGTPDLWARRTVFDDGSAAGEYSPSCKGPTRDLIVAAVNALPALLDELDAARAEVATVDAAISDRGVSERDCGLPLAKRVDNLILDLKQCRFDLAAAEMENAKLRAQLQADDQRAWESLGKPEGTHDTTNVQRLCAEVERLRSDMREAVELLGAFQFTVAPGELGLHERRTALLEKHKETP
jgi:outer membrane murein-binding lipoprotein Lpp